VLKDLLRDSFLTAPSTPAHMQRAALPFSPVPGGGAAVYPGASAPGFPVGGAVYHGPPGVGPTGWSGAPGSPYAGPVYTGIGGGPPYGGNKERCAVCSRILPFAAILIAVLAAAAMAANLLLRPGRGGGDGRMSPEAIASLAASVSNDDAILRGTRGTAERKVVNNIFNGTGPKGTYGPVILAENAAALRDALLQRGFKYMTLYHGTRMDYLESILNMGFRYSAITQHGAGIYAAGHLAHAECYIKNPGDPVIELQVFFREEEKDKYVMNVGGFNELRDTHVISDPLLMYPVNVHKCCEVEPACV